MAFWCNGKKSFCNDRSRCSKCKHYDGSGGEERENPKRRIIKALRTVKPKEPTS